MARFSAVLDACVLVPIMLADTLLRMAEAGLYRPLWSERILDEVVAAVERVHPDLPEGSARRRVGMMEAAFEGALVDGWQDMEGAVDLPDPADAHVAATALVGRADLIVTMNLKDFPQEALSRWGVEVQSPDEFLLNQLDLDPDRAMRALVDQIAATHDPELSLDDLLKTLARCGVPTFAAAAARQKWRVQS